MSVPRSTTARAAMRAALATLVIGAVLSTAACVTVRTGSDYAVGPAPGFVVGALDKRYSGTTIDVLVPSWAALPESSITMFTELTGIRVVQQTLDFNTLHDKIVTAEAAGVSPADVTEMDWTWVAQFGKARWYTDLSKYLPSDTISTDVGNSTFRYGGTQVAVPYNLDFRATAVDMTVLNKVGLTTVPTTWQEVLAAAQAVKGHGAARYPVAMPLSVTEGSAAPWYALTKAAGGEVLDANQDPAFTGAGAAGRNALIFVKKLYDSELIAPGSINLSDQDVTNEFLSGQAPIVLSASPSLLSGVKGDTSRVANDDVRFIAVPGITSSATRLIGLQEGLGIPANSAHREAAAEFVYWWQQVAQQITSYTNPNMGNLPSQRAALTELATQPNLIDGKDMLALAGQVSSVFPGPAPFWYPQFSTDVAGMLQTVAEGRISTDQAVSKLSSQTEALKANGQ